MLIYHW